MITLDDVKYQYSGVGEYILSTNNQGSDVQVGHINHLKFFKLIQNKFYYLIQVFLTNKIKIYNILDYKTLTIY